MSHLKDFLQVGASIGKLISNQNTNFIPPSPLQSTPSEVPSSSIGRLMQYGQMASSLGIKYLTNSRNTPDIFVKSLTRMRGAALKLGQMVSIQDALPEQFQTAFERLRDGAQPMPFEQLDSVMKDQLGSDWIKMFDKFDNVPFAAASIGQVHFAEYQGKRVAVKVQYPGIGQSIKSDLSLLKKTLLFSNFLPKGLFIDNLIQVAEKELFNELDYITEKDNMNLFRRLVSSKFNIPICMLATEKVLITEYINGKSIDKIQSMDLDINEICTALLELTLKEIFEWRTVQTDPNWSNFLVSSDGKIHLLDFGNTQKYSETFIQDYKLLLKSAINSENGLLKSQSIKLGFLTENDSLPMIEAYKKAISNLVEPFQTEIYDFGSSLVSFRVKEVLPDMAEYRLRPPPNESYSLHRKLCGMFLLFKKLGAKLKCKEIFSKIIV